MKEERLYPYSPGHREVETSIEAAEAIKEGVETIRNKVFNVNKAAYVYVVSKAYVNNQYTTKGI